jgi:uncharacterized protein YjbJ (UPF0337 family)
MTNRNSICQPAIRTNTSNDPTIITSAGTFDGPTCSWGDTQPQERCMNWDRIAGNWKQFTGKAKEQWGKLTDDDWTMIAGKRDQLVGKIQERYGVARDEAERQVKEYESTYEQV